MAGGNDRRGMGGVSGKAAWNVDGGKGDKRGMMAGGKGSWWQVERVEGGGGRWKG